MPGRLDLRRPRYASQHPISIPHMPNPSTCADKARFSFFETTRTLHATLESLAFWLHDDLRRGNGEWEHKADESAITGRAPREEEDAQGPREEADHIHEAIRECYDDGGEEEG